MTTEEECKLASNELGLQYVGINWQDCYPAGCHLWACDRNGYNCEGAFNIYTNPSDLNAHCLEMEGRDNHYLGALC